MIVNRLKMCSCHVASKINMKDNHLGSSLNRFSFTYVLIHEHACGGKKVIIGLHAVIFQLLLIADGIRVEKRRGVNPSYERAINCRRRARVEDAAKRLDTGVTRAA
jgi:hypothetical protein